MFDNIKNVLVLAPHTDDGELGCGGTINKLAQLGKNITYVAFSNAWQSLGSEFKQDTLLNEVADATQILGVPFKNLRFCDFEVRNFARNRQEILDKLIIYRNEEKFDLVFTPVTGDIHQDHKVITDEAIRAFKNVSILGYELPWNNLINKNQMYVPLEDRFIKNKISALSAYKSQRKRSYMDPNFIEGLAKVRGVQINEYFAESFEVIRWVVR
jgi:LmbE family N-acetylglucosaminyl deacetylase